MKALLFVITITLTSITAFAESSDVCQNTDAYKLFRSQNAVIEYHKAVVNIKKIQQEEREITREANGARDLALERSIALRIVTYQNLRDVNFKQYKKLGGKAASVDRVTREIKDPCI